MAQHQPPIVPSTTSDRVVSASHGSHVGGKSLLFSRKVDRPMSHRFVTMMRCTCSPSAMVIVDSIGFRLAAVPFSEKVSSR
jgi:hypothetical protein